LRLVEETTHIDADLAIAPDANKGLLGQHTQDARLVESGISPTSSR
jgi:hypothetical protein